MVSASSQQTLAYEVSAHLPFSANLSGHVSGPELQAMLAETNQERVRSYRNVGRRTCCEKDEPLQMLIHAKLLSSFEAREHPLEPAA